VSTGRPRDAPGSIYRRVAMIKSRLSCPAHLTSVRGQAVARCPGTGPVGREPWGPLKAWASQRADMPESNGQRPDSPDLSAGPEPLSAALGWMADRTAEMLLRPSPSPERVEDDEDLLWGKDAASFPPAYWHWKHEWNVYRNEHTDIAPAAAPAGPGPLLSIVVPVYRPALWYFRECVGSVIDQSYRNWELCLCDDGSKDPELTEAMQQFAAADPRIKALSLDPNGGISAATNRALAEATGEFIVLLDHDDALDPEALSELARVIAAQADVDVIYSDEDKLDEIDRPNQPHMKPDWDPDLLLSYPYLGHVTAIRHELLTRIGGFRSEFDGSQDFDVMLRATEQARRVVHIPRVLYHWRVVAGSAAGDPEAKPWAYSASRRALEDAVVRRGIDGSVETGPFLGAYHLRRRVQASPTVAVIIPFRDQGAMTMTCLESLDRSPGYPINEVVLVDNGSIEPETRVLHQALTKRPSTRVLDYPGGFNWPAINNQAAATCTSDMLLFLNNDVEATSEGWLHAMVELAQRPEIGAVAPRLNYPDGSLQHAGVVLGVGGIATHIFNGLPKGHHAYFGWERVVRSYSALSAACMLVRREVFEEMGGFDEAYPVAFNDVDFCLRLGQAGYRLLYTPHAELTHHESLSRGLSGFSTDFREFVSRWGPRIRQDDPFYNRNLSRFAPWCPLRLPGEDEEWLASMEALSS
jgi:GT2 family glycosyltransferase